MPPNKYRSACSSTSAIPDFNNVLSSALLKDMHIVLQIIDAQKGVGGGNKKNPPQPKKQGPEVKKVDVTSAEDGDDCCGPSPSSSSHFRRHHSTTAVAVATGGGEAAGAEEGSSSSSSLQPPQLLLTNWYDWVLGCLRFTSRLVLGDVLSRIFLAEVKAVLEGQKMEDDEAEEKGPTTASPVSLCSLLNELTDRRNRELLKYAVKDEEGGGDCDVVGVTSTIIGTPDLNIDVVESARRAVPLEWGSSPPTTNPLSLRPSLVPRYSALVSVSDRIHEIAECINNTTMDATARKSSSTGESEGKEDTEVVSWMAKIKSLEEADAALPPSSLSPSPPTCFTPVGALFDDTALVGLVDGELLEEWVKSDDAQCLWGEAALAGGPPKDGGKKASTTTTPPSSIVGTSRPPPTDGGGGGVCGDTLRSLWTGAFITNEALTRITASVASQVESKTSRDSSALDHLLAALRRQQTHNLAGLDFSRRTLGQLCFSRLFLRCRLTPHTVNAVGVSGYTPFTISELISPFLRPVCNKGLLHVGAKALAKHIHRDQSEDWWCSQIYAAEDAAKPPGSKKNPNLKRKGELVGSETTKNARSESVLAAVVGGAVWQNLHLLPHGHIAYELRQQHGHGARWCVMADTTAPTGATFMFRGFLEPHAVDGHEKGWAH